VSRLARLGVPKATTHDPHESLSISVQSIRREYWIRLGSDLASARFRVHNAPLHASGRIVTQSSHRYGVQERGGGQPRGRGMQPQDRGWNPSEPSTVLEQDIRLGDLAGGSKVRKRKSAGCDDVRAILRADLV
jgi:hypothetical protein